MRHVIVGRPGLALLLALAFMAARPDAAAAQSAPAMVVLVRHAEPAPGGGADPSLSAAGRKRAEALATALRDAGVTAILTSEYRRTRETAEPLASALGVTPTAMSAGDIGAHVKELATAVRNHRGGAILVVGHSNTVPALIKALGGPELPDLCGFDNFLVLVLADGNTHLTRSRYGAEERNCW